jgi:hypothetical protein
MTYEEAVQAMREGKATRHQGMSKGWKVVHSNISGELFLINPHTGSDYLFAVQSEDRDRSDWECVPC